LGILLRVLACNHNHRRSLIPGHDSFPMYCGVPFACVHALFNLSKLAVWWLRLGIGI
jgi:hypothetical protein